MARRRVPVVGTGQLNTAQLSAEQRRIEAHRAREAARREYAPQIQADRGAIGVANKQYQSEAASARGATDAVQTSLAQALAGLKESGLSGRALQQTKAEFTSRAGDAAMSLPALLAGAGEERGKALTEARSTLAQDRAAMLTSQASKFNSALSSDRNAASSVLAAQKTKAQEAKEPDSTDEAVQNATNALKDYLSHWGENINVEVNGEEVPIQQANPLKTADQWRTLAHGLEKEYDGFSLTDAVKAIHAFLIRRKKASTEDVHATGSVPIGG